MRILFAPGPALITRVAATNSKRLMVDTKPKQGFLRRAMAGLLSCQKMGKFIT